MDEIQLIGNNLSFCNGDNTEFKCSWEQERVSFKRTVLLLSISIHSIHPFDALNKSNLANLSKL